MADQHDEWAARLEVGCSKGTAEDRSQRRIQPDECRERSADPLSPDLFGLTLTSQDKVACLDGGEMFNGLDTSLEVAVLGEREVAAVAAGDGDEAIGGRIWKRLEKCGVDDREDRGRSGDANRERGNRGARQQADRNTSRNPKRMS